MNRTTQKQNRGRLLLQCRREYCMPLLPRKPVAACIASVAANLRELFTTTCKFISRKTSRGTNGQGSQKFTKGKAMKVTSLMLSVWLLLIAMSVVAGAQSPAVTHNTWTSGAAMPTAVNWPAVGAVKGKIYVVG